MEVFLAVIAVVALWSWVAQRRVAAELPEPNDDDDTMITCRVEWHGSQCYVYRQDTGEFLGQGQNLDQAVAQMVLRGLQGNWCIPEDMAKKPEQIQP